MENGTFQLDSYAQLSKSSCHSVLEPVSYKSTLRVDNTYSSLDAQFLDLNHTCGAGPTKLGTVTTIGRSTNFCICYQGLASTSDFRTDTDLTCIRKDGYLWGFAGVLALIGTITLGRGLLRSLARCSRQHSLFRMAWKAALPGNLRNVLDVASAVRRDLGEDAGAHANEELEGALARCEPVRWQVRKGGDGVNRIGFWYPGRDCDGVGLAWRRAGCLHEMSSTRRYRSHVSGTAEKDARA